MVSKVFTFHFYRSIMRMWRCFHFDQKLHLKIFLFVILLCKNFASKSSSSKICLTYDGLISCHGESSIHLTRIDGRNVSYIEDVELEDGRHLGLKTVSVKPLVIEVPDFLTKEECEYFIELAKKEGLENSQTAINTNNANRFVLHDDNHDKKLSVDEMRRTIEGSFDTYLDDSDVLKLFKDEKLDKNNDELITPDELAGFSPAKLQRYITMILEKHPEKHSRYSQQVWLYPDRSNDPMFKNLQERVSKIVQLPIELIKLSDFQVVTYDIKGHYNAHYDSSKKDDKVVCCTRERTSDCRICRYMTILFYLSDVEEGGETAFPVANNETVEFLEIQRKSLMNLYKNCDDVSLKISPKQGKAIIWYNHQIDPETGWLGQMDDYTFHGGCPVRRGRKWIANFWIKTTDDKSKDLKKMKKLHIPPKDEL